MFFLSYHCHPAIDLDGFAGDIAGFLRRQIGDGGRDLLRQTHAPGRDFLADHLFLLVGKDLGQLRAAVTNEFLKLDEHERSVRTVMAKLETGFLRRFVIFQHG